MLYLTHVKTVLFIQSFDTSESIDKEHSVIARYHLCCDTLWNYKMQTYFKPRWMLPNLLARLSTGPKYRLLNKKLRGLYSNNILQKKLRT